MRMLLKSGLAFLLVMSLMPETNYSQTRDVPLRHVIICIDGVGIDTIEELRAAGHFRMFQRPSRMISSFPSLTNAAMTSILRPVGAELPAGYEDNFYDTEANKMRGGIFDRLRGDKFISGTFRELFDYHPSAIKSGLGYAAPPISTYFESLSDLIRLRQKARNHKEQVFFGYTGATDSLAHLGGEKFVRKFLKQLDNDVINLARKSPRPLKITIFSDHGNHFRKYRRIGLKDPLRRAGYNLSGKIENDASVVLPQFGLIGNAVLFTRERNEPHLAGVLAEIQGVDFAAYENEGVVHVVNKSGVGTIERRNNQFRYRVSKGDPLQLLPVVQRFGNSGEGFIDDSVWFSATRDTARPDALRRIYDGATEGVRHRASVLVNLENGYYTGNAFLDTFAILQATHGNIGPEQSFGFVMTTEHELPEFIRAEDLWQTLGAPRLGSGL